MRARDVKDKLKEMGFERGTAHILQVICERQSAFDQEMKAMQQMLNKMSDIMLSLTVVGEQMKKETENMRQTYRERDDLPPPV